MIPFTAPDDRGKTRPAGALLRVMLLVTASLALGSCGGGGGGGDDGGTPGGWQADVFLPSAQFANRCVAPRSGTNPATGASYPDVQGTVLDENNFLRSFSEETYLWYDEIIDRNPAGYNNPLAYFDVLRTMATTDSGQPRDKFHFTYDSEEWYQLSQSGVSAGYGAQWVLLSSTPPREVRVAYTEPNSPATDNLLARGDRVLAVDGVDINDNTDAGIDTLNAGLFSPAVGEPHEFLVEDAGGGTRTITMTAEEITADPVQNVQVHVTPANERIGYLLFNDHILTAESGLVEAIEQLGAGAGVDDLVLDIRYNGGGYLFIASQLAYMIAGNATDGRIFEEVEFNDKHPATNPITGDPLAPTPFYDITSGFGSLPGGQPLPTLNLPRVFVLTGPGTCSASEAIINGLRGIGVEVIQIGSTTCGKPYGFYPKDNCGTTYFTIQFRGVNEAGFGDYTDGFSAQNQPSPGTEIPGCSVGDDFEHLLGDPDEARFATALAYRNGGLCPAPSGAAPPGFSKLGVPDSLTDGMVVKPPHLTNRIMTRWQQ